MAIKTQPNIHTEKWGRKNVDLPQKKKDLSSPSPTAILSHWWKLTETTPMGESLVNADSLLIATALFGFSEAATRHFHRSIRLERPASEKLVAALTKSLPLLARFLLLSECDGKGGGEKERKEVRVMERRMCRR